MGVSSGFLIGHTWLKVEDLSLFAKANNFSKIWLLYPSAHASLSSPLLYESNHIIIFSEIFLF